MNDSERLTFASLSKDHDRTGFDCGVPELNRYLQRQAGQEGRKRVAFSFAMTVGDDPCVLGFYTLSSCAVPLEQVPANLRKKLPHYPYMPVTLLGRLAVDKTMQGKGVGVKLLIDALERSFRVTSVASMAVVTDPKDDKARAFYQRYGFESLDGGEGRLFLRMQTIGQMVGI